MDKIGFVSSIPIEVIFAAAKVPCDLNNRFITHPSPRRLVEESESRGYPRNHCAWLKGIYQVAKEENIKTVIQVTRGDCGGSQLLMELLKNDGVEIIPFAYPFGRERSLMEKELESLTKYFKVSRDEVERAKRRLDKIRAKLDRLDEMSFKESRVRGYESYIWQVSSSDFNGDPDRFEHELDAALKAIEARPLYSIRPAARLGILGVPAIVPEIYNYIESLGGLVVYSEMAREFTFPSYRKGWAEQYLDFTYPYGLDYRLGVIRAEIERRGLDGIIHYVQSFCPREAEDIIFREKLKLPYLTLECNDPLELDGRNRTKLEAFMERWCKVVVRE
ncbi:MAG: 2-hydroxyacyl-CoA dehydratase [Candidatus Omnitrophica bacterium]|nr:2-hydroxyacyl-CoA dehydratase [Candidatus Omnitrophota bacterium]